MDRWFRNLVIAPFLILLVLLGAILVGTFISELLYPLEELKNVYIP